MAIGEEGGCILLKSYIHVAEMFSKQLVFSREGNGTPLRYCCLENPMDGGAWWAAVSQSRTRLKRQRQQQCSVRSLPPSVSHLQHKYQC